MASLDLRFISGAIWPAREQRSLCLCFVSQLSSITVSFWPFKHQSGVSSVIPQTSTDFNFHHFVLSLAFLKRFVREVDDDDGDDDAGDDSRSRNKSLLTTTTKLFLLSISNYVHLEFLLGINLNALKQEIQICNLTNSIFMRVKCIKIHISSFFA